MTPNTLSDSALSALTSGDGSNLDASLVPAFRAALIKAGFGDTDTAEIPESAWNKALDVAVAL